MTTPTTVMAAAASELTVFSTRRFWRSHLMIGFLLLGAEAVVAMGYLLSHHGPHPGALLAIAATALLTGLAGCAISDRLAQGAASRSWIVLGLSVLTAVAVGASSYLDGGLESPYLFLIVLPIMFSSLVLSPSKVAACSAACMGTVAVVGLTDDSIEIVRESLAMFSGVVISAGILAIASSAYRKRLETAQRLQGEHLLVLATTDPLTGCANHRVFHERLRGEVERSLRHQCPLTLAVADVDLFKLFNDTLGHEAGDAALARIGSCLRHTTRTTDVVARIGGDEFAILMPDTDLGAAAELGRRILEELGEDSPTVSLGLAELGTNLPTAHALFGAADGALYQAKAAGRARLVLATKDDAPHPDPSDWPAVADLRRAEQSCRVERRRRAGAESLLGQVLDEAPVGFALVNADMRLLQTNPAILAFFGDRRRAGIGNTVGEAMPQVWPQIEPALDEVLTTGTPVRNVEVALDQDTCQPSYRLANFFPVIFGANSHGVGVVVIDITDRRRAERAQELITASVVEALAAASEARDPYTAGHQRRVSQIATAIATEMNCGPALVRDVGLAASIHDIGKLAIPAEILSKPGRLSPAEYALVQGHPKAGYDMLADTTFPWPVAEMLVQHHERLDGSGYPDGLRGDEITLGARIIAVADVLEAMSAHRPYRTALGRAAALCTIQAGSGRLFDPEVVRACLSIVEGGRLHVDGEETVLDGKS